MVPIANSAKPENALVHVVDFVLKILIVLLEELLAISASTVFAKDQDVVLDVEDHLIVLREILHVLIVSMDFVEEIVEVHVQFMVIALESLMSVDFVKKENVHQEAFVELTVLTMVNVQEVAQDALTIPLVLLVLVVVNFVV